MSRSPSVLCIIPARYASTRLPGKPLVSVGGLPLIMWAYNRARESGVFSQVCVATDDTRILNAVRAHGGDSVMTDPTHLSGTDRCCEVARSRMCDFVVNLQGDEPDVPVDLLRLFGTTVCTIDDSSLLTCATDATIRDKSDPNTVKVVLNVRNEALYFSRAGIPFDRDGKGGKVLKHTGIYGFSRAGLLQFCGLPPGELERCECLEQLRALEHGMRIKCLVTQYATRGIDTPEDLREFRASVGDVS